MANAKTIVDRIVLVVVALCVAAMAQLWFMGLGDFAWLVMGATAVFIWLRLMLRKYGERVHKEY